ncbi:MAG: hypothetical protein A2X67_01080 [Ignavibacteria bacterium GWA2_55_11]|nr:MAG: hypothetical protein A2X67_01080 [Ignavibacteria bacterium GWA2_55_11]OGU47247.1 MAG: hypothetical protein A2X68_13105 [Ignavibacteria bacterium GWC2_56_12]OGU68685.1 MAG: hypothetical protein A3C56_07885 [Ignavibacteria bacterium RIFCSPHIGHO2_02_FULL_56_12]OGU70093.1 MAG: hypothetical protein A3H45_09545 [Ignavibacteria bacterium RIFCSPLOWO2_02_FULL_55_14]OGU75834.1 MAG: hypothetical protein A3G43_00820 [Ignavibacteria bacterium RIFCSPLOWO2_12_FULL_56_21]
MVERPQPAEHIPYYTKYIDLVPETDVILAMSSEIVRTAEYLRSLPQSAGEKRYAPGKWSVKEVVGHMIDTERVMGQRALFFARKTPHALPGYEPDDWVNASTFGKQSMEDLISEFENVRKGHVFMFKGFGPDVWSRKGIGSGNPFTVRALAFIIVGHERHHVAILKERYA